MLTALSFTMLMEDSFKKNDGIRIRYFPDGNAQGIILYPEFPKAVAVNFSDEKWAKQFPALNRKDLFVKHPVELHIRDCDQDKAIEILEWMLRCCNGTGFKAWWRYQSDEKPFSKYYDFRNAAEAIGCTYLMNEFHSRMTRIGERQIHSEDVRAIFEKVNQGQLNQNDDILEFIAKHVATHIFNQTLRAKQAYNTYRDQNNLFDTKVKFYLLPLIDERRAHNRAEQRFEQNQAWAEQINNATTAHQVSNKTTTKGTDQVKINDDGTAKLSCDVAVRGKNGRPTFVRPPPDLLMDSGKLHRKGYEGGGKTPQRFRHKEGETKHEDNTVNGVNNAAKDLNGLKINDTAVNTNGVGGKVVPGTGEHDKIPISKNARKRAKKQAKKQAEEKSNESATVEKMDV